MINRLVVFGATGDLTARYLLPGLAALAHTGHLPVGFALTGASREAWDTAAFRDWTSTQLDRHAAGLPEPARQRIVAASTYEQADVTDPASVATAVRGDQPIAAYLALPPAVFAPAIRALHEAGLPSGSTMVLEKPFGNSLAEAIELNALLSTVIPEDAVFRVDHFLAMTTVQNILGTRMANRVLEPIWNGTHIAEVDVIWEESLALEGRAGYYDGVGALKDVLQNHLLQIMCLIAMEPPISVGHNDLRDRKVDVLRSVRPLSQDDVVHRTRRARYTAGHAGGKPVPAYRDEDGVRPDRQTETFAEIELELDNWRWPGTTFRLRSGKAFGRDRKEVVVRFRGVPHLPFDHSDDLPPNELRFGLEPDSLTLALTGIGTSAQTLGPLNLSANLPPPELPAYGRLLHDVLNRDPSLSIRGDEAEQSWRIVTPILAAWFNNLVPIHEYPAGHDPAIH